MHMVREDIKGAIEKAIKRLQQGGVFPDFEMPEIEVDHPENKDYGDYSTSIAFQWAKTVKKNQLELGDLICSKVKGFESDCTAGFINFFISKEYLQTQVGEIIKQKEKFGEVKIGKRKKVNVEFISANPTGPLTLGNGRGGFCGDVLSNVLRLADYKVTREYYINDVGEQIKKLGHSILGDKEAVYKGVYIDKLKKQIRVSDAENAGVRAGTAILEELIKPQVKKMGIKFDVWFSEKGLHSKKAIAKALGDLKQKRLAYEKEDALWFKSAEFGDDKDRVLVKADGETTYLTSDIAYLRNKFNRGFEKLIFFWGADHYGYVERIKAAAVALGYKKEQIDVIIMQLVKLFRDGQEVRMSKRTGIYVAIDELIDEVGLDVARFFFLSRAANTHLDFDIDLAREESEKNPVYYVQYAHARICSILKKAKSGKKKTKADLKLLTHESELKLIKELIRLPEIIEDTARDYQIQRLPQYAVDLATAFHAFYRDCKVLSEAEGLQGARLTLISATQIVLENTLELMGISAPGKM